ncbi:MAG: UpxY family transcription antiterminator [Tannerellaceae bacterium]|jgi:transcription antitermination factor NusG|nr:UpxY family transcription antiterminator [Tannerellaceae bacterium]
MTVNPNTQNWYVLYTSPRAEKQVRDRLAAREIEVWLPLHQAPRVWSDRVKIVELPLFNSYVFVKCKEHELHELLKVYGVSHIVFFDGKPAVIRQREIDAIRDFLEQAVNHTILIGDEVKILSGSMKNISGKVKKIKKKYLFIYLEQMGVTAQVDLSEVIPVKRLLK